MQGEVNVITTGLELTPVSGSDSDLDGKQWIADKVVGLSASPQCDAIISVIYKRGCD